MWATNIEMSICTYNDGKFDIIFRDADTMNAVTFSGNQKLTDEEFDLANSIAPACVYSKFTRAEQR